MTILLEEKLQGFHRNDRGSFLGTDSATRVATFNCPEAYHGVTYVREDVHERVKRERDLLLLSQSALLAKVKQLQRHITKTKRRPRPTEEPELSKAAKRMLGRLRAGHFYMWDPLRIPKAMAELEAAGLVGTCGRVQTVVRCWVPADGYLPFVNEVFEEAGQ